MEKQEKELFSFYEPSEFDVEIGFAPEKNKLLFYSELVDVYLKIDCIKEAMAYIDDGLKINPQNYKLLNQKGNAYFLLNDYEKVSKYIDEAFQSLPDDYWEIVDIIFDCYELKNYMAVLKYCEKVFDLYDNIDNELTEKLEKIATVYEYDEKYKEAIDILENIQTYNYVYFNGMDLQGQIRRIERVTARIDERNKIIADLSHSIKNLISTIIDPLENLKQESVVKPLVINNALKGANLIREIVNGMNLSFSGSIDDFYFDAKSNKGKDRINFKNIIIESLKYSIGNMFDGKYFSNSMRKYFPAKSVYLKAKSRSIRNSVERITKNIRNSQNSTGIIITAIMALEKKRWIFITERRMRRNGLTYRRFGKGGNPGRTWRWRLCRGSLSFVI